VPEHSAVARACAGYGNATYNNATSSYTELTDCTLKTEPNSWALVAGNLGVGLSNTAYEAAYGLGLDTLSPASGSTRYVNAYPDSGDGLDGSVTGSLFLPVSGGTHTFYLIGKRQAGTGTVLARSPRLFVLTPTGSVYLPLALNP
jgi:hypothetical protein